MWIRPVKSSQVQSGQVKSKPIHGRQQKSRCGRNSVSEQVNSHPPAFSLFSLLSLAIDQHRHLSGSLPAPCQFFDEHALQRPLTLKAEGEDPTLGVVT